MIRVSLEKFSTHALFVMPLATAIAACSNSTSEDGTLAGMGGAGGVQSAPDGPQGGGAGAGVGGGDVAGGTGGSDELGGSGGGAAGGTVESGGDAGTGGAPQAGAGGAAGEGSGGADGVDGPTLEPSNLPAPPGAAAVPKPSGAPGNLQVIDWAGFSGAVSYTFDDSNSSQVQNYDALQALGVPFTFYLQTGKSESMDEVWNQALADGHELGNHTRNHSSNDDGTDTDAATEFLESRFQITVYTMAAPNGSGVYTDIAKSRFLINRGVNNAIIMPNDDSDPFTLPCYIPRENAPASEMNQQIDSLRDAGGWRTVLVHGFTGGNDFAYQPVALSEFEETVTYAKSFGDLWVDTVLEVAAYWRAQKVLAEVEPIAMGDDLVYSWTLPEHFPPNRYLRVTLDGGTLTQDGLTVPWNDHGYYEIALDPGSVTISP